MTRPQYTKFSPYTAIIKDRLRKARLKKGLKMQSAAARLGISRKQLEDIETRRNYGCHLDLELLAKASLAYDVPLGVLLKLPKGRDDVTPLLPTNGVFQRPRARGKQA